METATLTSKSQITVPKAVREALGVGPGDRIQFVPAWQGFRLVVIKGDITSMRGALRGRRKAPVTIEEMNQAIAEMGSRPEGGARRRTAKR
jgi:antitoxin PrlF